MLSKHLSQLRFWLTQRKLIKMPLMFDYKWLINQIKYRLVNRLSLFMLIYTSQLGKLICALIISYQKKKTIELFEWYK